MSFNLCDILMGKQTFNWWNTSTYPGTNALELRERPLVRSFGVPGSSDEIVRYPEGNSPKPSHSSSSPNAVTEILSSSIWMYRWALETGVEYLDNIGREGGGRLQNDKLCLPWTTTRTTYSPKRASIALRCVTSLSFQNRADSSEPSPAETFCQSEVCWLRLEKAIMLNTWRSIHRFSLYNYYSGVSSPNKTSQKLQCSVRSQWNIANITVECQVPKKNRNWQYPLDWSNDSPSHRYHQCVELSAASCWSTSESLISQSCDDELNMGGPFNMVHKKEGNSSILNNIK